MKEDQTNKTNVERVYREWHVAWEPSASRSGIDPRSIQQWVQHSCAGCASMLWSWSGAQADEVGGSQRWVEKGKGGCDMTQNCFQVVHGCHLCQSCSPTVLCQPQECV